MKEKSKRTKFLSEYSYIAVYVIILIVYVITNHGLTMSGFMNIFRHSAVIGIIGFGMGLICLTGDIDLSVGSMLALVSGFSVVIFNMTDNILLTFLFAVGFGAVCGLINGMLESWGMDRQQWYMKPAMWPPFLVFMNLWKGLGYGMVVYLATITGIDKTYYEAAGIDGATIWQQIRYITLPLMKTVIIMMFIMAVGRIFYSDFGLFYQVPRDSNTLYNYVYTLDVYVFKQLKTSTTGMASAAAFVQSVAGCITILTANAIVRKIDRESAMI